MQLSVDSVQVQPVPAIAVAVKPVGNVSVTVTAALVAALPLLVAVIVYVASVCPCVKLPLCDLVMSIGHTDRIDSGRIGTSVAGVGFSAARNARGVGDAPGALAATFTVSVMAG